MRGQKSTSGKDEFARLQRETATYDKEYVEFVIDFRKQRESEEKKA